MPKNNGSLLKKIREEYYNDYKLTFDHMSIDAIKSPVKKSVTTEQILLAKICFKKETNAISKDFEKGLSKGKELPSLVQVACQKRLSKDNNIAM